MSHRSGGLTAARENRLLAALPPPEFDRLARLAPDVPLKQGAVVYRPNTAIRHVYFPRAGILSAVIVMGDGGTVEVGTIGNEGFAGVPVFLGTDRSPTQVYVQVAGVFRRMDADAFRAETGRDGPFRTLVQRYTQITLNKASQSAACNRLHGVEERLARWLLMTQDRVGGDELQLTQQILSEMLGVRRASVTVAVGVFQKAGLIEAGRGRIRVLDRRGLEAVACECYGVLRAEVDRLLG